MSLPRMDRGRKRRPPFSRSTLGLLFPHR
jgi:hypothetical protein